MTGINGTILVADDEPESLRLLTGILSEEGYQVRPADSGELALAAVTAEAPELILLDIRMPGMDGFEVCRRIRACEESRQIPLMFISATTDPEERVEGLALGAVDFVSKPFQRAELLARVRTHLELGRLRTQLEKQVAQQTAELRGTVKQLELEVAERHRTEMALRESEERFRVIFSQAAVGIAQTGPDTNWLLLNDRFCEILGYTQAELREKTFLEITHPDDREASLTAVRRLLAGEISSWLTEKRYVRKEGAIVWVRLWVSLVRDQDNRPQYFIAVVEDVTERMEAEREQKVAQDQLQASERRLIESEERLKGAQRLSHVGNWEWDIKAERVFWSEELYRIFGKPQNYTPDYEGFLHAVQPQDRGRVDQAVRDALEGKRPYSLEFQITRPDGDVRTIACIAEVTRDDGGLPVRMYGACQDITDQRRAEASLRRNLDEIAHLNRVAAMGELATSLAHELNQPLAAILLNSASASRFLNGQPPNLARVRECLNAITADDERAGEVIQRLRGLLKKGESQASLVYVNEVVSDALRLVGNDALLRQISVEFEPLSGLPPVRGDRIQLYQVVLNLIVNGFDAVAERPPGDRWVLVRTALADGGGVELTVEDSGKGIAEGDLARVFEPFFTTKREGLGMGLSISQSIVQAHGGRIWAENGSGGGAIFRCLLPAAQQARAASGKER